MSSDTLDLKNFNQMVQHLEKAPEIAAPHLVDAMQKSVALVHDLLAEYPPSTEANQPGRYSLRTHRPMGYYERGRGYWYPIMRKETLGSRTGKRQGAVPLPKHLRGMAAVAGYKLRRTSERLGSRWTTRVETNDNAIQGVIGTTVSYADYVQGQNQAAFQGAHGWQTAAEVLQDAAGEIKGYFEEAAKNIAEELRQI
jgi:hypothetical protein